MVSRETHPRVAEAEVAQERIPTKGLTPGLRISSRLLSVKVDQSIHCAASRRFSIRYSHNSSKCSRKAARWELRKITSATYTNTQSSKTSSSSQRWLLTESLFLNLLLAKRRVRTQVITTAPEIPKEAVTEEAVIMTMATKMVKETMARVPMAQKMERQKEERQNQRISSRVVMLNNQRHLKTEQEPHQACQMGRTFQV